MLEKIKSNLLMSYVWVKIIIGTRENAYRELEGKYAFIGFIAMVQRNYSLL